MKVPFDEIADTLCLNCDWFGMQTDLELLGGMPVCPECASEELVEPD